MGNLLAADRDSKLELLDLHKSYDANEVLKGVSLTVAPGEVIAIVGASGSGKSTLLRCINLLEIPQSGVMKFKEQRIDYCEVALGKFTNRKIDQLRASIGMVFQNFNLWPHKTVLENITEAPVHVRRIPVKEAVDRADSLLQRVGLGDKRDAYPRELSGGQQQRVAIARALAMDPEIMLFDEVTSALDPELVGEVLDLMQTLAEDGMTMLVVTHEMGFARHASHRTAFFHEGQIAELGPSADVLGSPKNDATKQFLDRVLHHA